MMKFIFSFIFSLFIFASLNALMVSDPEVQALVDQPKIQENQPIKGMISITHEKPMLIDLKSFTQDGKPLKVEKIREVEISPSSSIIISYFQFELKGNTAGLYMLPEIKVKVGDRFYSSIPTTYEIDKPATSEKPAKSAKPEKPAKSEKNEEASDQTSAIKSRAPIKSSLKLTLEITGTPLLYPKQQFQAIYRFFYEGDIELTNEVLPLLNPTDFSKVGTKETKDYQENEFSVQQISQRLEAIKPGDYVYGTSEIQGRAYQTDSLGNKVYQTPDLKASVPSLTLHVVPFPAENKPPSFNEALGPFDLFKVSLVSSPTLHVGDKILLKIDIGGEGQVETVSLPELCCQPGFSGVFQLSDLPPSEQISDNAKHFIVEMRPLTALVKEIPSIEFSFFVPKTNQYGILKSDPLPITITPIKEFSPQEPKVKSPSNTSPQTDQPVQWKQLPEPLPSIEIIGNFLVTPQDLYPLPFSSWWFFLLIPFGTVFIILQLKLKEYILHKKKEIKIKNSHDYFDEAVKSESSSEFHRLISQAFLLGLKEKGEIGTSIDSPDSLMTTGIQGEIRDYLLEIEKGLFGGVEQKNTKEWIDKAQHLFQKLRKEQ